MNKIKKLENNTKKKEAIMKNIEIKNGINLHIIKTNKFKTNLLSVFLSTPLRKEKVTQNALIPAILRRGTVNMKTQDEISMALEEMYGATFDCGIDKIGDNHVFKFYFESINDLFLPQNEENMLKESIDKLLEIVCNPYIENNSFNEEYVEQEKENIKRRIEAKVDNKARYAIDRCIEEMYKNEPYGLYKYGYVEDLEKITTENLYEYYNKLINECKIDIFISGEISDETSALVKDNDKIKKLRERDAIYVINNIDKKLNIAEEI